MNNVRPLILFLAVTQQLVNELQSSIHTCLFLTICHRGEAEHRENIYIDKMNNNLVSLTLTFSYIIIS